MTAELADLFNFYGTDKARGMCHEVYGPLLGGRREQVTAVLEVGIGTLDPQMAWSMVGHVPKHYRPGGSLRAWRDYFPHAQVWGIDVAPDTMIHDEPRIHTALVSSLDWVALRDVLPPEASFDLIVDDGDHSLGAQLLTLTNLWARVKPGGFYVVEDRKQPSRWLDQFNSAIDQKKPHQVFGSIIVYRKPEAR